MVSIICHKREKCFFGKCNEGGRNTVYIWWCPTQLRYYERPQEKTMVRARGGKGLENSSGCGPCHDPKQSLDPFRFAANYVKQTASSDRITAWSGCSVTPHPDCLLGHIETPPQWRAAINEHGHGRTAPEITECALCPLGIYEAWCVWLCVYIYSLCILGHQGQSWLREELAQQNNIAWCSWHCVHQTTAVKLDDSSVIKHDSHMQHIHTHTDELTETRVTQRILLITPHGTQ